MSKSQGLIKRLFHYAETQACHDAIVTPFFSLSYLELAELTQEQVKIFNQLKISKNSVVGVCCADDTKHLLLSLAAIYVGATACTIPSYDMKQTQDSIIKHCRVSHVVDESMAVELTDFKFKSEISLNGNDTEQATVLFSTSGTTGKPKIVIHDDSDLVAQAHRHISSEQERFVCLTSMEHNFVKRHRLYCIAMGATNVLIDKNLETLVEQCLSLRANVIHVSAFQAQELLAIPNIKQLSTVRIKLGGSHVALPLRQQLAAKISPCFQAGYGTTETGAIAFTKPDDKNAGESVGQPLPGIEVSVVTPSRKPLKIGERGELAIRCEGMFQGYLDKPDITAERLKNGWFYTGDIGYLDKQQRIHLCGRADDMFVFNSMNIYPQDIESQLSQYPDIVDVAVLPKSSLIHGDIPVALVVFSNNVKPDLSALKKFMRKKFGDRRPRQFSIVKDIPRNSSGKISRREAIILFEKRDQIRSTIIEILHETKSIKHLKSSLIESFQKGSKDIGLREIEMDSIVRMELLVALETAYEVIITPQDLSQCQSLGDIASLAISISVKKNRQKKQQMDASFLLLENKSIQLEVPTHVVRFFRRVFSYCVTVAQLRKALATLEERLTPEDVECLYHWHAADQLIPNASEKFQTALTLWLQKLKQMMLASGKQQVESFTSHRVAPTVTHFIGPGVSTNKTLLICFAVRGCRHLLLPNAVLLQHINAELYDVLVIAEPLAESYRLGVPCIGNNVSEVIDWLACQNFSGNYAQLRTLGCSAGGYPAILAGYRLGAQVAVSVAGRFPYSERYPLKILKRIYRTWQTIRHGHCSHVVMSYGTGKNRDFNYARIIAGLSGGTVMGVEFTNEKAVHNFFQRLSERGELMTYLKHTVFVELDAQLDEDKSSKMIMSFPDFKIKPA